MRRIPLFAIALSFALVLCGSHVDARVKGMGRLNGTVSDGSGTPLEGVAITIHQGTDLVGGKSDAKGQWVVSGVAKGEWIVTFAKDGLPTKVIKIMVEKEALRNEPIKAQLK